MGIRGLTSLVNENPGLLNDYQLKSTHVVIDGTSLAYRIFLSYKVECSFCGEYLAFKNATLSFLNRLRKANVTPLFVFDGPMDKYGSKFQTVLKRHKEAINCAVQVMQQRSNFVLPMLAFDVFLRLLDQQNSNVLVCTGDADRTIAACAIYLNCPVISMDSDFLVFPLNKGYIPFNSIDLSDMAPNDAINCSIYNVDNWLKFLPRLDRALLPIFAIVTGNDFFTSSAFENFFDHITKPQVLTREITRGTLKQCNMVGFLEWLQDKSYEEALEGLLCCASSGNRQCFREKIENALSFYNVKALSVEECKGCTISQLLACGFPKPFTEAYCTGKLYRLSNMTYVRLGQTLFLPIVLENISLHCVHECSKPLRAIIYGIMLKGTGNRVVTEYTRVHDTYQPIVAAVKEDVPSMSEIANLSKDDRRKILTCNFSFCPHDLDAIPEQLHLFVLSLKMWTQSSSSTEQITQNVALALAAAAIHLNAKFTSVMSESLRRLYKKPLIESHQERNRYFTFVHAANQWQSCLDTIQCLNDLLIQPFREADVTCLFSGKLAFNLYQCALCSRRPVETVLNALRDEATVFDMSPDQLLAKLQLIIPFPKELSSATGTTSKTTTNKTRHRVKDKVVVASTELYSDTSTSDWDDDNSFAALKLVR
ncbi:Protein asteroid homolog 1 [Trichuris trichiura]|uniref:Protein asteroid homolog 1 n=1 Tax=Trichuris trichiura TaxID=36087 RepID=A0A077YW85_TRITR|nr:Protein asteroid homolog 1 [Trichuris trichiura]